MHSKFIMALTFSMLILASNAFSAQYDIKELTSEIKSALDSRKARFGEVSEFKKSGLIGENNRGYLEVLGETDGRPETLVAEENKDRKFIYAEIAEQNGIPQDAVEKAFGLVQFEKAKSGEQVQDESGNWITK